MFLQVLVSLLLLFNPFLDKTSPPIKKNTDGIVWTPDRRLNWDDFQSSADANDPLHAMTSTNIEVKANCYGNLMKFEVKCVFINTESWSKNKSSKRLLEHEQMHFDLTEVYARMLRQKLSQTTGVCSAKVDLQQVVDKYFNDWKKEQDIYDADTNHGLKEERQKFWADIIAKRLESLEIYAYK